MIIAIDGPAGSGKSTVAKTVAGKLNFYHLNSGDFYRAVTYKIIRENATEASDEEKIRIAESCRIQVKDNNVYLDGVNIQDKLHTPEMDMITSKISSVVPIRSYVNKIIHELTESLDIVAEGRDMTTVVFPNADYKFYLDAKPEVRAMRRHLQNGGKEQIEEVLTEIRLRDENDRNKKEGALKIAPDAIYIDTSYLTIDKVCEKVLGNVSL